MINKKSKKSSGESEVLNNQAAGDPGTGSDIIAPHKFTRKERRHLKKEMRRMKPLWRRISWQFVRTLLIRVPLVIIAVLAVTLFTLKIYLTPVTVQKLATSVFAGMSNGSLKMDVTEFNIYRGCVIRNIVVRSGADFNNEKVFEMEKFVFRYHFFRMFTGSIRFPEIGLYKPRVYLKEKNGKWNVSTLMKPSEKKVEEPEEEDEGEISDEISLPISVDFLLNFYLDDLRVFVKGADFSAQMQGLTFNANIDIPPFKKIPKSVQAVKIIRTMRFELNPSGNMDVSFYSNGAESSPDLVLNWKLIFNNGDKSEFNSSLEFGAKRMPLRLKDRVFSPFDFMISYDIFLNPIDDSVRITDFTINFKGSNWLKLGGTVGNVTKNQVLKIDMKESRIPLKDLYPYYVLMTGDRATRFNGDVSLYPLSVRGTVSNPDVKGGVNLKNIYFKIPGTEASIPSLVLDYSASGPMSRMELGLDLKVPHIAYVIEGSKSGGNGLKFNTGITALDGFSIFRINTMSLNFYEPVSGKDAVAMLLNGEVNTAGSISGWINISRLRLNTAPLKEMVPGRFRKSVESIPLKKPVNLGLVTKFFMGDNLVDADLDISALVPDYGVEDLKLSASVQQDRKKQRVTVEHLTLGSRTMNLLLAVNGTVDLKKSPMSDSNLKVSLELNNSAMKNIFGPWATSGMVKLTAGMKGDLDTGVVKGSLVCSGFNLKNDEMMLALYGLDMNFPFEYELAARKAVQSYLTVTQKQVIESEHFKEKPNFTIKSFSFKHPARERKIEYMKDFSALMYFRENVFRIADLKASVMDGSLYARSIMFNFADFKLHHMEFDLILDATNINIGRMDEPDYKKVIPKDAELSLSANFSGKGLNINRELTVSGYINIYEIGIDFANRLMKGLSQEKGKSKLGQPVQFIVDNSMGIEGFDFKLDKGLAYPTVKLWRKIISVLAVVDRSEVKFDRIPVQEYLRKVTEE
ncbi:MAG TPA: hypothetical protein PK514_00830 [Spirochaetota bacterium]|nr:hypothetical protein [Spirochaetota bacterium]